MNPSSQTTVHPDLFNGVLLPPRTAGVVLNRNNRVTAATSLAEQWLSFSITQEPFFNDAWFKQQQFRVYDQHLQPTSVESIHHAPQSECILGFKSSHQTRWLQCQVIRLQDVDNPIMVTLTDVTKLMSEVVALRQKMEQVDCIDTSTGLYNRRYMMERFSQLHHNAIRYDTTFSAALINIDRFKRVNDTYGHDTAEWVLERLATVVKKSHRETDLCGRFGGGEFLILMPETEENSAILSINRLRQQVSELKWDNIHHPITISAGVIAWQKHKSIEQLFFSADQRLKTAKRAGRNQVCGTLT